MRKQFTKEQLLFMLSGGAFLLLIAPAWVPGFLSCIVFGIAWCAAVWFLGKQGKLRLAGLKERSGALFAALVFCTGLGSNFCNTWADSRYMGRISGLLGISAEGFVLLLAMGISLGAIPAMSQVIHWFFCTARQDYRLTPEGEKGISFPWAVAILSLVYILGISAILKANMYYQDDAGRGLYGYKHWDYFGRYLSTGLATIVHGGDYLVDIAPFPQILAMVILAFAAVLMAYILLERTSFSVWELAALVPVGLNPWFLECVSFRFDAPYMGISVLAPVLPLLWWKRNLWAYMFAAMLGAVAVCTSYQSAAGVFPMLVIALALLMYIRGGTFRESVLFCLKSAAGYAFGMVFFVLALMKPADAGYVSTAVSGGAGFLENTIRNYSTYFGLLASDLKAWWWILAGLMILGFFRVMVSDSRRKKFPAIAVALSAFVMMTLLCFGAYPVLKSTLFRPRAMYGAGILLAILALLSCQGKNWHWRKAPALALSWVFFVFALTFGNVLCHQVEYTDLRMDLALGDVQKAPAFLEEEPVVIYVEGDIGTAPVLQNMPQEPGILRRLVPATFAGGSDLTLYRFLCNSGLPNLDLEECLHGQIPEEAWAMPILADTAYHTIRTQGNIILVELK